MVRRTSGSPQVGFGLQWDTVVCHKRTMRHFCGTAAVALAFAGMAPAQTSTAQPDWRRIGSPAVDLMLASPATGPVDEAWYAAGGNRLLVRTRSGKIFETGDFETWKEASAPSDPAPLPPAGAIRLPEGGARVFTAAGNASRIYALGGNLFRS